jgi:hypothetical protein
MFFYSIGFLSMASFVISALSKRRSAEEKVVRSMELLFANQYSQSPLPQLFFPP